LLIKFCVVSTGFFENGKRVFPKVYIHSKWRKVILRTYKVMRPCRTIYTVPWGYKLFSELFISWFTICAFCQRDWNLCECVCVCVCVCM